MMSGEDDTPTGSWRYRHQSLERALLTEVRGMRQELHGIGERIASLSAFQRTHHDRLTALEAVQATKASKWGDVVPQIIASIASSVITTAIIGGVIYAVVTGSA